MRADELTAPGSEVSGEDARSAKEYAPDTSVEFLGFPRAKGISDKNYERTSIGPWFPPCG